MLYCIVNCVPQINSRIFNKELNRCFQIFWITFSSFSSFSVFYEFFLLSRLVFRHLFAEKMSVEQQILVPNSDMQNSKVFFLHRKSFSDRKWMLFRNCLTVVEIGNYFHVEVVAVECSERIQIVQTWFQTVCAAPNSVLSASNCAKIEVVFRRNKYKFPLSTN